MANNVEYNLKFTIDGKEGVIKVTDDVKQLAEELGIAKDSGEGLRDTLLTFN